MEENKSEYEATSNSYRKAPKIAQKMLLTKAVEKSRTKLQEITSMQENGDYTTARHWVNSDSYNLFDGKGDHRFHCAAGAQVYPQANSEIPGTPHNRAG